MDERTLTDNRTTEQRISKPLLGFVKHQRNRGYIDAGQAQWLFNIADEIDAKHEQAIAATLGKPEIVRCRDCMYFTPEREPETSGCFEILHPSFCDMHITKTEPDGFCSFSKRKEGERWQYSE